MTKNATDKERVISGVFLLLQMKNLEMVISMLETGQKAIRFHFAPDSPISKKERAVLIWLRRN